MLSEKLNLTDEQKTTLKPIPEDQAQQVKAIHADTSLSEEQKRDKMKAIHETFHDKINTVLTPEQQVKFKAKEARAQGDDRRKNGSRVDHPSVRPEQYLRDGPTFRWAFSRRLQVYGWVHDQNEDYQS